MVDVQNGAWKIISWIAYWLDENPHPALIFAARHVLEEYDRRAIPDWVAELANGDVLHWPELLEEVRRLKFAEETYCYAPKENIPTSANARMWIEFSRAEIRGYLLYDGMQWGISLVTGTTKITSFTSRYTLPEILFYLNKAGYELPTTIPIL